VTDNDLSKSIASTADRIDDHPPLHTPLWALLSGWLLTIEAWLRSHGGDPLRYAIRGFWILIAGVGVILLVGPVINPPTTLEDITSSAQRVTEQWVARDFAADYTVSLADDGTLVADVEERITSFFPDGVDAEGIERVIATQYQKNSLSPSAISATFDGAPIDVVRKHSSDRLTLTMNTDNRLSGDHEFVLRYTLHNLAYDAVDDATGAPTQILRWDVFGPSWPQGLTGLDVTLSLSDELDGQLVRQPRGYVGWTIVSAGSWLEPEELSPRGFTTYNFTNDQNLPPNANAMFTVLFTPGTIAMPPPSTLFWLQTFAPLVPLAVLLATLLLSIAARRVAWSDERGEPWYVAHDDPPENVSAKLAAHILRSRRTVELAEALQSIPVRAIGDVPRKQVLAVGRIAHRTGRLGDLLSARRQYGRGSERAREIAEKLRRIPVGFVRDAFIAAPIAITVVQWGIVRQLSYQATISVIWWPFAFVTLSSLVAIIVLSITLTTRPLTREGALLKQHLLGIGVYAQSTSLLERALLTEPVLPYAVLTAPAREAGEAIAHAAEAELGEKIPESSWRNDNFLTAPRFAVRGLAVLIVVSMITITAVTASPFQRNPDYLAYNDDVPGSYGATVESFSASAELGRNDNNRATIDVRESLDVAFMKNPARPSQVVREWPAVVDGQDLQLSIQRVLLDGKPVPYVVEPGDHTLVMRTTFSEIVEGDRELSVDYRIASAAVATETSPGGQIVDRVRWGALLTGWRFSYGNEDGLLDPFRIELRLSDELADKTISSGWITLNRDDDGSLNDSNDGVVTFGSVATSPFAETTVETTARELHAIVRTLTIDADDNGWYPIGISSRDLGTVIDFPSGTFAGPDTEALRAHQFLSSWPLAAASLMGWFSLLISLLAFGYIFSRGMGAVSNGIQRDVLRWIVPALAISTSALFIWVSIEVAADHPANGIIGVAALAGLSGATLALWLGWRSGREKKQATT
jgi:hypothetical protein